MTLEILNSFFAKRVLKESYSEERALFLAQLMKISREGHLCWKTDDAPSFPSWVVEEGKDLLPKAPVVVQKNRYYLQKNWVYETYILEQVRRLKGIQFSHSSPFPLRDSPLPEQQKAVESALQNGFTLICGGPGTGKTYTAGVIARLLATSKQYKIALAAPTGKAASHLQTVLGSIEANVQAATLHRLLRLSPGENNLFSKRKIDADLLIVDEASMLDVPLMAHLLEAIGNRTRVVMMGDPDQLPPIEAGSLFSEMAALFGITLQKTMRTNNVRLQDLAEGINRGELNYPVRPLEELKLFERIEPLMSVTEPDPIECLKRLGHFRVLGALRQGPFGVDALNRQMIRELNEKIRPGQWWAVPIMITSNQSRRELYNGSCGVLIGKSEGGVNFQEASAYFPEKIPFKELPSFEVAFCLSIHKSQGSEFDHVVALFPQGSENFGKEALYTAVTRAKKEVELFGEESILRGMLSQRSLKISGFTDRFLTEVATTNKVKS